MERPISILVVDDEQIVLDSIQKHLRKEDYVIHCVLTPHEGLEKMKSEQIDIVLTDLMMPEIDGLEFMKIVKEDRPKLPVVMITGYATINTALQATQLGAFDYIAKPFSKKELLAVVSRAADLVRASESEEFKKSADDAVSSAGRERINAFRKIGEKSWLMLEEGGVVMMGVESSFVQSVGKIQTAYLPARGDEIRQGSVYLQIFSSDLSSHVVHSPLSGIVVEVNERVVSDPVHALQDPYGDGWIIRIKPSRFDFEIKLLGL
jgi:CheY-like chemotaxis protein/glycine cleavage system H lipoate-binding protein